MKLTDIKLTDMKMQDAMFQMAEYIGLHIFSGLQFIIAHL